MRSYSLVRLQRCLTRPCFTSDSMTQWNLWAQYGKWALFPQTDNGKSKRWWSREAPPQCQKRHLLMRTNKPHTEYFRFPRPQRSFALRLPKLQLILRRGAAPMRARRYPLARRMPKCHPLVPEPPRPYRSLCVTWSCRIKGSGAVQQVLRKTAPHKAFIKEVKRWPLAHWIQELRAIYQQWDKESGKHNAGAQKQNISPTVTIQLWCDCARPRRTECGNSARIGEAQRCWHSGINSFHNKCEINWGRKSLLGVNNFRFFIIVSVTYSAFLQAIETMSQMLAGLTAVQGGGGGGIPLTGPQ